LCLGGAGLLPGTIAPLRLSPRGPLVLGILSTSSYPLLLVVPERVLDLFNADLSVAGRHADMSTPIRTGTSLVVGVLLLVCSLRMSWRRAPRRSSELSDAMDEPDHPLGADGLDARVSYSYAEPEPRYAGDAMASSWAPRTSRPAGQRW